MTAAVAKRPRSIRDLEQRLEGELVAKCRRWWYALVANGLTAYARPITGRAEPYWRPLKRSARIPSPRCPYHQSADSGDAAECHDGLLRWRKDFDIDGDFGVG